MECLVNGRDISGRTFELTCLPQVGSLARAAGLRDAGHDLGFLNAADSGIEMLLIKQRLDQDQTAATAGLPARPLVRTRTPGLKT